ncbi:MAG: ABC transporter ATP-binding protein/permease [Rhodospirillales bacterium]|nr:ABC transporter ATP-binding protein/permease [Rhodospirillales bacterium]
MAVDAATLASIVPIISMLTKSDSGDSVSPVITSFVKYTGIDGSVEVFISIFVILSILNSVLLISINYFILKAQYVVRRDMVLGIAKAVFHTSANYINRQRQGDFLNTLTLEAARVADSFTAASRLIAPIAQALVLLCGPLLLSWKLTVISMTVAFLLVAPLRLLRSYVYRLGQGHTKLNNKFSTVLQEALSNTRMITAFGVEKKTLNNLDNTFSQLRDLSVKSQLLSTTVHTVFTPIGIVIVFITFLVGRHLGVPLSEIGLILYAFNRLAVTFANINQFKMQLLNLYPSYEQVMKVREEADASSLVFGDKPFSGLEDEVSFENVSFSYSPTSPALKNISITIPAGKMTALVGGSGSGKSTLADLVLGMQQPTEGQILIDNVPMNEIDIFSYRNTLGYVPQQPALLHASIRENILWADSSANDAALAEVCRLANAHEFIDQLEDGIETIAGDRGVRLSGGQVQRISLARALVRKPQILVLDEATSALDSQSEKLIQASVEGIMGRTTMLVIAHRLSTIAKADNIIVLDQGRVVEQGTFDELMAHESAFANLVKLQQI